LAERPAHDCSDAPVEQSLRGVLARGATAEVLAGHQHGGALVGLLVEGVLGVMLARVFEGVLAEAREGDGLQEPGRADAVGVDVVSVERNAPSHDLPAPHIRAHRRISRTSATAPAMAAAATMAGLIRSVRPVGLPWRPMKFRLLDDALTSRPLSLSSFIPKH